MSEAARTRRDDARYEPVPGVHRPEAPPTAADPLAELARLVGQDDPFRGVFRPNAARAPALEAAGLRDDRGARQLHDAYHPAGQRAGGEAHPGAHEHDGHPEAYEGHDPYGGHQGYDGHQSYEGHEAYDGHGADHRAAAPADAHHGWHDEAPHDGYADEADHAAYHDDRGYRAEHGADAHRYAAEGEAYHDEAGLADGHLAADAAAATLPDMWARGGDGQDGAAPRFDHGADHGADYGADHGSDHAGGVGRDAPRPSSARRPLAVLAAVLVLTGGGLAASFLVKGPSTPGVAAAGSGRAAPTIMAAAGPTKVKVDDAGATAPEDKDAALLNKSGNASSGPVRIVSSQEQPADLGQLPKSSDLAGLADGARPLPPAAPSPFPEPKRVKTFVVHPDGTMLSADGAPAAAKDGADAAGTPSAATPRTTSRGATTPSSTPKAAAPAAPADAIAALAATPADGGAAAANPAPAAAKPARQPASPGVRTASAKPNDTADAPSASGGSFGVQLASSPVEADANAAFAKLKKKYPAQLGSLTASVHKAETGDKPIYRVRVGSMSQDEANTLCSQLKGAGGSCFVVHN